MNSETNFQKDFNCGICNDAFDEDFKLPRRLSCNHSYCHSCLIKLLSQIPNCPTCHTRIRFTSVGHIPINFSMLCLIKARHQILMNNALSDSNDLDNDMNALKLTNHEFQSEGHCTQHNTYKGIRCMDCDVWVCGMCAALQHKLCRTHVVADAYIVIKNEVSDKVAKELEEFNLDDDNWTESLNQLNEDKKCIIEEILKKQAQLRAKQRKIQQLESLKCSGKLFIQNIKQLKSSIESSTTNRKLSKAINNMDRLLIPRTLERLENFCIKGPVFVVEENFGFSRYGKVAIKDKRIMIHSFQPDKPDGRFFMLNELLSRFNKSTELPRTVFLKLTPKRGGDGSFQVTIATDGISSRAKNFVSLCSLLNGSSFSEVTIKCDSSSCEMYQNSLSEMPAANSGYSENQLEEAAEIYGVYEGVSGFSIQLDDGTPTGHKFGVVVEGLQNLEGLRGTFSVLDCGLVI